MYTNPFNRKHSTIRQILDRFLDPSRKSIRRSESVTSSDSSCSKSSNGSLHKCYHGHKGILQWSKKSESMGKENECFLVFYHGAGDNKMLRLSPPCMQLLINICEFLGRREVFNTALLGNVEAVLYKDDHRTTHSRENPAVLLYGSMVEECSCKLWIHDAEHRHKRYPFMEEDAILVRVPLAEQRTRFAMKHTINQFQCPPA